MSRVLPAIMSLLALQSLAIEAPEGETNPKDLVLQTFELYELDASDLTTEQTAFSLGYTRGLRGVPSKKEDLPFPEESTTGCVDREDSLFIAARRGYAFGLEGRELASPPPADLIYEAFIAGTLHEGGLGEWVAKLNYAEYTNFRRFATPVVIGHGATARTIPAGTPVRLVKTLEKDNAPHAIVMFDGLPVIVPNPTDAPVLVDLETVITKGKPTRAAKGEKAPKTPKAPKLNEDGTPYVAPAKEAGRPTLQSIVKYVLEGEKDGQGVGPFQTNAQFAARVLKRAIEVDAEGTVATLVEKCDTHVPFYCGNYKPEKKDPTHAGRMGVESPLAHVVARVENRATFLKIGGDTFEQKFAQLPQDIREACVVSDARLYFPKAGKEAAAASAPAETTAQS